MAEKGYEVIEGAIKNPEKRLSRKEAEALQRKEANKKLRDYVNGKE